MRASSMPRPTDAEVAAAADLIARYYVHAARDCASLMGPTDIGVRSYDRAAADMRLIRDHARARMK